VGGHPAFRMSLDWLFMLLSLPCTCYAFDNKPAPPHHRRRHPRLRQHRRAHHKRWQHRYGRRQPFRSQRRHRLSQRKQLEAFVFVPDCTIPSTNVWCSLISFRSWIKSCPQRPNASEILSPVQATSRGNRHSGCSRFFDTEAFPLGCR
jgi:hypothetical protein